jgi:hypothetical protein
VANAVGKFLVPAGGICDVARPRRDRGEAEGGRKNYEKVTTAKRWHAGHRKKRYARYYMTVGRKSISAAVSGRMR